MKVSIQIIALLVLLLPSQSMAQSASLLPIPTFESNINNTTAAPSIDMDLVVEADTYIPSFYAGRREPAAGSLVRLTALPFGAISPTSYRWQIGSQNVVTNTPYTSFTFPGLAREIQVTVTAVNQAGQNIGSVSETIRASVPKVIFYETNSLKGTSNVAIADQLVLIGDEVGVRAEPYFFGGKSLLSTAMGEWSAFGVSISSETDWRKASLLRLEGSGNTDLNVKLDIRNDRNLSETVSGKFKLTI